MNDSAKRAIVGEAIILAAWLAIMFVCKSIWMNPLTFALSLAFGVLAFAVSSISIALPDRRGASNAAAEVNMLPVALCCTYFAAAIVANTYFCFAAYGWVGTRIPAVVNIILLAIFVLAQIGLNSYAKQTDQKVSAVAAKTVQTAQFGSYVGQLLAATEDPELKDELKALKDDISFSSNMSQPHVREIEQQFSVTLEAIANSMGSADSASTTISLVRDARQIWKKRNAALTAVK